MDYRLGALLDGQLGELPSVKELRVREQKKVTILCHAQIPPDPFGDELADQGARRLASKQDDRKLRRHLKGIVNRVLRSINSKPKKRARGA